MEPLERQKTKFWGKKLIFPLPCTGTVDPLAIATSCLPTFGVKLCTTVELLAIWLVAPESTIHGSNLEDAIKYACNLPKASINTDETVSDGTNLLNCCRRSVAKLCIEIELSATEV